MIARMPEELEYKTRSEYVSAILEEFIAVILSEFSNFEWIEELGLQVSEETIQRTEMLVGRVGYSFNEIVRMAQIYRHLTKDI